MYRLSRTRTMRFRRMTDFKIIYGVEAYLVDDLKDIVVDSERTELR